MECIHRARTVQPVLRGERRNETSKRQPCSWLGQCGKGTKRRGWYHSCAAGFGRRATVCEIKGWRRHLQRANPGCGCSIAKARPEVFDMGHGRGQGWAGSRSYGEQRMEAEAARRGVGVLLRDTRA